MDLPRHEKCSGWLGKQFGQIGFRIQTVSLSGCNDGINRGTVFGSVRRVAEQPVLASYRKRSDGILDAVVVNRHIAIFQKCIEILSFVQRVIHGLG